MRRLRDALGSLSAGNASDDKHSQSKDRGQIIGELGVGRTPFEMQRAIHLLLLLALASAVVSAYEYFAPDHFYAWFLRQGSYVSLSVTFVSMFWKEVDKEVRLISSDPVQYVNGCRAVLAGVIRVLA